VGGGGGGYAKITQKEVQMMFLKEGLIINKRVLIMLNYRLFSPHQFILF
jgi:hypothetical protein